MITIINKINVINDINFIMIINIRNIIINMLSICTKINSASFVALQIYCCLFLRKS